MPHPSVGNSRKTVRYCEDEIDSLISLTAFDLRAPPNFDPAITVVLPSCNQSIVFWHRLLIESVNQTGIDRIAAYVAVIPSIEFHNKIWETKGPES